MTMVATYRRGECSDCHKKIINKSSRRCRECNDIFRTTPPEIRFWKFVDKTPSCWNWSGLINASGYGHLSRTRKLGLVRAHRFSWELHKGKIPEGLWVLHKCDNRKCVNPEHLFIGNNRDNVIDMITKGRNNPSHGEDHRSAKLTIENVKEILHLFETGYIQLHKRGRSIRSIARKFGVGHQSIRKIIYGHSWKRSLQGF